jgi:surface antigen
MSLKGIVAAIVIAAFAAGCGPNVGTKQTVGTLGGAAAGGLIGSQFGSGKGKLAMVGIGVLLGGLAGSEIGRRMDESDRLRANQALAHAQGAPVGQTIAWNNPENGHHGTVTAVRDGTSSSGEYCREFQQTVSIGGKTEDAYGTACRQPDGSWKIVQ